MKSYIFSNLQHYTSSYAATTTVLQNINWLFLIPVLYTLFSIAMVLFRDVEEKQLVKFKRFYYSIWLFAIVITIKLIDINKITIVNTFGIPQVFWVVFFVFIIGVTVAVLLDMLIISGNGIKEITLGWAKISRAEIKQNIEVQRVNIDKLIEKIKAEYEVIQGFEGYMAEKKVADRLRTSHQTFHWASEIADLIDYYCSQQLTIINVYYYEYDSPSLENTLKSSLNLTEENIRLVKRTVEKNQTIPIRQRENMLFIPYTPVYYGKKILYVLKGKDHVFEIEQRLILNIIKMFENYATDILASIPVKQNNP